MEIAAIFVRYYDVISKLHVPMESAVEATPCNTHQHIGACVILETYEIRLDTSIKKNYVIFFLELLRKINTQIQVLS
jgi:hypothetical protein